MPGSGPLHRWIIRSAAAGVTCCIASFAPAHDLPLGDGHVTNHPVVGNVYACSTTFRHGGARHAGPWFHGDTWNPAEKPHVEGRVFWPEAAFSIRSGHGDLRVVGNGLPLDEPTGEFPISPGDPAYRYDTNPNHIGRQDLDFEIPAHPVHAAAPGCLPMGMIGITVSGVAIYNALDDGGRDAAAHEVQDDCNGHPQANSQYHYHNASPCIPGVETNTVVGWALDGYPILGLKDANGDWVTNTGLDACHGRAGHITIDGRSYDYAYHMTREYPYTLGCFSGRVLQGTFEAIDAGLQPSRRGRRGRPRH